MSTTRPQAEPLSPLAALNAYIRTARAERDGAAVLEDAGEGELASVRRFRQAWESGRTQEQVERAVARAPANAGPLNSHALVLRSLALMQDLSPDYLLRFLAHAEALQWLEQAREQYPREQAPSAKSPRRARRRKP